MGTAVIGATDPGKENINSQNKIHDSKLRCTERRLPCDASVGGHDEDGGHVTLQGSVEEREALNVQHVHLIYEEHLYVYTCTSNQYRNYPTHAHTHTHTPAHTHTHTHTHTLYHTHGHTIQTHTLTPGTISALPSSLHSATFALICSRTSPLISPVSPALNRTCTQKKTTSISGHQQLRTRPTYELTKHGCLLVS